ncbi:T9SS type A sorting domain-containing protein [Flavobacterium psychrotolerans]|uniref:Secretion system C-terminal sorting domain-containing protein n=1 Tax=Flavobacterium psychrotolerans TaxID=2169410 RepID=A0A2U1JJQ0_9FLAO|nr:T9SS type A sorting domain-containing protein [Flavobacterium psychrotolerans]PWA05093.1 hypothetical protein DB895_08690 [Flavobacterium psychrotolerans]
MKTTGVLLVIIILFLPKIIFAQDGVLDTTFGTDGKVLTTFGYESDVQSLALQPDGKIIAAGDVFNHGDFHQFGIARYHRDGSLDTTFGVDGRVVSDFLEYRISLNAVLVQKDGKIIVGGLMSQDPSLLPSHSFLVRYTCNGTIDSDFGIGGKVIIGGIGFSSLALQSDGSIIAAGYSYTYFKNDFVLLKYEENGILDDDFGINGVVTTSIGENDFGHDVALQSDGKIVLLGGYQNNFAIARYDNDGILDPAFGSHGIVVLDIDFSPNSVKIQSDGKIVCASMMSKLVRLLSNGDLDTGFGIEGIVQSPVSVSMEGGSDSIAIQNDGKIIVGGSYIDNVNDTRCIALVRYQINGDMDTTFGIDGLAETVFGQSSRSMLNCVLLQPDDKIVVGGESGPAFFGRHPNSVVLRYDLGTALTLSEFNNQKNRFSAYPNPVGSTVNLDCKLDQQELFSVNLFDCNGKMIANLLKEAYFKTGYNSQKLELPETLAKGIYFLNISNGQNSLNVKIVK